MSPFMHHFINIFLCPHSFLVFVSCILMAYSFMCLFLFISFCFRQLRSSIKHTCDVKNESVWTRYLLQKRFYFMSFSFLGHFDRWGETLTLATVDTWQTHQGFDGDGTGTGFDHIFYTYRSSRYIFCTYLEHLSNHPTWAEQQRWVG